MTTYITNEGEVINAASPIEVVERLREGNRFTQHETAEEYMAGFASRHHLFYDRFMLYSTPDEFVACLLKERYLTIV